ncbi:MAG: hypothetical protein RQ751_01935 [Longimicrobiales bacterium]|nr:hypothetical protein [Longimicrobiales bacterium]
MAGFPAWPGWLEPFVAEVFSAEGDRVALVEGPDNLRIGYARGDTIWGFLKDDMGAPLVVRMVARWSGG